MMEALSALHYYYPSGPICILLLSQLLLNVSSMKSGTQLGVSMRACTLCMCAFSYVCVHASIHTNTHTYTQQEHTQTLTHLYKISLNCNCTFMPSQTSL